MRFKRSRVRGVTADLTADEAAVLGRSVGELLQLLTDGEPGTDADADPLEAMVGLSSTARRPDDDALLRLFPDAYCPDAFDGAQEVAAAASDDFRRYTEDDLRAGKRASADVVLETLAGVAGGGTLRLDRDQCDAWLGTLNDLRLVLGVRLGVTEEMAEQLLPEDDPRAFALHVFSWLGWLQETLVEALEPRPS